MKPTTLPEHIRLTYFSLRIGLGLLAFVFPILLASYGYFVEHIPIQKTMSDYYFAFAPEGSPLRVFPMRGLFVGILWAIGCFLILYRGFSKTENWLLNLAGLSAIGVAFFPIKATCTNCSASDFSRLHYSFAIALFVFLACVAWFCNEDSLRELRIEQTVHGSQNEHKLNSAANFRFAYNLFGALMIAAPLVAVGVAYFAGTYDWKTLVVEWAGIWVFSAYWLVKSYELSLSRADEKAATGKMTVTEPAAHISEAVRRLSDKFRESAP